MLYHSKKNYREPKYPNKLHECADCGAMVALQMSLNISDRQMNKYDCLSTHNYFTDYKYSLTCYL